MAESFKRMIEAMRKEISILTHDNPELAEFVASTTRKFTKVYEGLQAKWECEPLSGKLRKNIQLYLIAMKAFENFGYNQFGYDEAGKLSWEIYKKRMEQLGEEDRDVKQLSAVYNNWYRTLYHDGFLERLVNPLNLHTFSYRFKKDGVKFLKIILESPEKLPQLIALTHQKKKILAKMKDIERGKDSKLYKKLQVELEKIDKKIAIVPPKKSHSYSL